MQRPLHRFASPRKTVAAPGETCRSRHRTSSVELIHVSEPPASECCCFCEYSSSSEKYVIRCSTYCRRLPALSSADETSA